MKTERPNAKFLTKIRVNLQIYHMLLAEIIDFRCWFAYKKAKAFEAVSYNDSEGKILVKVSRWLSAIINLDYLPILMRSDTFVLFLFSLCL